VSAAAVAAEPAAAAAAAAACCAPALVTPLTFVDVMTVTPRLRRACGVQESDTKAGQQSSNCASGG
jgi:hypothetical protein